MTNILRLLHEYVPVKDGQLYAIPCHGDQLSVERMCDAMRHSAGSEPAAGRLEGIIPVPQEFHKRMILLQVKHLVLLFYCYITVTNAVTSIFVTLNYCFRTHLIGSLRWKVCVAGERCLS